MIVTEVTKIDSRRQKVILDNEYVFSLYNSEIRKLNIVHGSYLDKKDVQDIEDDILFPRAKERALYILGSMDKTEKQMKDKLKSSFYPDTIINRVLEFLIEYGYLDDRRYADTYIRIKKGIKSRRTIECELMQKGVSLSDIKACYEIYDDDEEITALKNLLNKPKYKVMLSINESRNKVIASMLRRGFSYEQITRCINEMNDN